MELSEYLEEEQQDTITKLARVEEGQLIIAEKMRNKLIEFEATRKEIDLKEEEIKNKLKEIMEKNGIASYESNDKKIKITMVADKQDTEETITYIDEDEFIKENKELHNQYVETRQKYKKVKTELIKGKKGYVRITIRDKEE